MKENSTKKKQNKMKQYGATEQKTLEKQKERNKNHDQWWCMFLVRTNNNGASLKDKTKHGKKQMNRKIKKHKKAACKIKKK